MKKLYAYTRTNWVKRTYWDCVTGQDFTQEMSVTDVKHLADLDVSGTLVDDQGIVWERDPDYDVVLRNLHVVD